MERLQEIRERWENYDRLIKARKEEALSNPQHEKKVGILQLTPHAKQT